MSTIVYKTKETSDDNVDIVIMVDQTNGDDTATIGDGKSAKSLQHALDMTTTELAKGKVCELRIVSDYIVGAYEQISRNSFRKCIITCLEGVYISGLMNIQDSSDKVTDKLVNEILNQYGEYVEISHSCHKMDALNYLPFAVLSIEEYISEGNKNEANVTMRVPSGVQMRLGQYLDIKTGWVNAIGTVTNIDGDIMYVNISSLNYKITTSSTGYYRILNYSLSDGSFCISGNGSYSIYTSLENFRIPKKSILLLDKLTNVIFKNCNFRSIGDSVDGLRLSNCYGIRFDGCSFEYIDRFVLSGCKDISIVDNYFYSTSPYLQGKHIYVTKNLFKGAPVSVYDGVIFEYNEICYSFRAIDGGIDRRSTKALNNKTIIQNNEIHHIGLLLQADMGAIYRYGSANEVIQYNYIHDCLGRNGEGSVTGIYFDEGAYGHLARYNIIVNCASSSYTHFGRGNIFYNNLFAYPAGNYVRYSKLTYECATSYIANIFYNGDFGMSALNNLKEDGSMFQFNVIDREIPIDDSMNIHSNEIGIPPFVSASEGDFAITEPVKIGDITLGSTDVRKYNQSTIDTSFFDHKISFGLPTESKWYAKREISLSLKYKGVDYHYDKWFIFAEMDIYNISNDYLTNKIK